MEEMELEDSEDFRGAVRPELSSKRVRGASSGARASWGLRGFRGLRGMSGLASLGLKGGSMDPTTRLGAAPKEVPYSRLGGAVSGRRGTALHHMCPGDEEEEAEE